MKNIGILLMSASLAALALPAPVGYTTKSVTGEKKGWWTAVARYPVFSAHSPVLDLADADLKSHAKNLVAGFLKEAPTDVYNGKPNPPFAFDSSFSISLANDDLVSLSFSNYQDTDGAHPYTTLQTANFGFVSGHAKKLSLQDLFVSGSNPSKQVNGIMIAALRKNSGSYISQGSMTSLSSDDLNSFVIQPGGLDYLFSADEVAPYVLGPQDFLLKYGELKGLDKNGPLKPFLASVPIKKTG